MVLVFGWKNLTRAARLWEPPAAGGGRGRAGGDQAAEAPRTAGARGGAAAGSACGV